MAFELQYTSAPHGLSLGQSGFTTVKMTKGIPLPLREALESLSSYHHGNGNQNARSTCSSLLQIVAGGQRWSVLSRSADAGLDHTHRRNFFVHHIALSAEEVRGNDPLSLLGSSQLLQSQWDGRVEELPPRTVASDGAGVRSCEIGAEVLSTDWKAAIVREMLEGKSIYVITPIQQALGIVESVLDTARLRDRWQITFITHYQSLPAGVKCAIKCIAPTEARQANVDRAAGLVIDVTKPLGQPPALANAAVSASDAFAFDPTRVPSRSHLPTVRAVRETTSEEHWQRQRPGDVIDNTSRRGGQVSGKSFGLGISVGAVVGLLFAMALAIPYVIVLQSRIGERETRITELQDANSKASDSLKKHQELQSGLESQFKSDKQALEAKIAKKDEMKRQLDDIFSKEEQTVKDQEVSIGGLKKDIADLQIAKQAVEKERDDLKKQVEDLKKKLDKPADGASSAASADSKPKDKAAEKK